MAGVSFLLNRQSLFEQAPVATICLDLLRERYRLTGAKPACREGDCGACTVLLGSLEPAGLVYKPVTACLLPLAAVAGKHLVTIEGLNGEGLNPIQQALVEEGGIQCGFCTPGIVLALTAFFLTAVDSDCDAALDAVAGNLCRCTGYAGIKRAVLRLCRQFDLSRSPSDRRLADCIAWGIVPDYFADAAGQLAALPADAAEPAPLDGEVLVGGGSDLWAQRPECLLATPLRFLPPVGDEQVVSMAEDGRCRVDAAASVEQLRHSARLQMLLPGIADDLQVMGSSQIRHRATVGGNLAHASPIGDLAVLFLALDAGVELDGESGRCELPLRDFFLGYKQTVLTSGERITALYFAPPAYFSFEKVCKRQHLDIASVNSALSIRLDGDTIAEAHVAAGGVGPVPLYLPAVSAFLRGKVLNEEAVAQAARIGQGEIAPIGDIRGSADYKRLLFRQLLFAHFLKLFPDRIGWEALHAAG